MTPEPDKPTEELEEDTDILTRFQDGYEAAYERERDNILQGYNDLNFAEGEGQWDEEARKGREDRPCLIINRLPQFIRQITGKMRQIKPSIKCVPVDNRGDPETAKILAGMFRYIENRSRAQSVYGRAADSQVTAGIGAWRVTREYSDDQTFNQEIRIAPIEDAVSVLFDPDAILPAKVDAMECFVPVDMSVRAYRRTYEDKPLPSFPQGHADCWTAWGTDDYVRVCEWWFKEPTVRKLALMPDGSVDDLTGKTPDEVALIEEEVAKAQAQGIDVRIEERKSHKVMRAVMAYNVVLEEPKEWPGRYIPIIPVVGEEIRIGRKLVRRGIVRLAKDAQRMYNYFSSAETEIVALQPKSPFIGTETNFENNEEVWETANTVNYSHLTYKPDPVNGGAPPQRSQPPVSSQGLTNGALRAIDDMKAVIGIYDASLGARSNETSGVAIEARDQQGDTGSFVYVDNFGEAITHTAQVVLDLIPKVYDSARTIRIVGEDDSVETKQINNPVGLELDGVSRVENDVTIGAYDVVVKMGPAFDSLRSEAREGMTAMIKSAPDIFPLVGDLIAKMQDWPYADELAERLEAVQPHAIKELKAKKDGVQLPPPPPSPEQIAAQQQAQAEAAKLEQEQAKAQSQAANDEVQRQISVSKAQSDLADAEQMRRLREREALVKEQAEAANIELTNAKIALTMAQIAALGRRADNEDLKTDSALMHADRHADLAETQAAERRAAE